MDDFGKIPNLVGPMVYIVSAGQYAKIGYTTGLLPDRVAGLQTGCPVQIQFVRACAGGIEHEAKAHRLAARDRTVGEWFQMGEHFARALRFIARRPPPDLSDARPGSFTGARHTEPGIQAVAALLDGAPGHKGGGVLVPVRDVNEHMKAAGLDPLPFRRLWLDNKWIEQGDERAPGTIAARIGAGGWPQRCIVFTVQGVRAAQGEGDG